MVRTLSLFALLLISCLSFGQVPFSQPGLFKYSSPVGFVRNDKRVPAGRFGFFAPANSGYSANVMVTIADAGNYTATQIGKESVDYVKANEKGVKILRAMTSKLAGKESYVIHMDRKLPNGMLIGQQQVLAIYKGKVVILTFSALNKSYKADSKKFENSLKTFAWFN